MAVIVGAIQETHPGERRVAITPKSLEMLTKAGATVVLQSGAGVAAGFPDESYAARGATIASTAAEVIRQCQVLFAVRAPRAEGLGPQHLVVGFCDPLGEPQWSAGFAKSGATLFSMELVPRTTRAQAMDALSSMASIAGYKAVILAAAALPRQFPMMMTAAGTIPAAKVLVLGAGVAGLQAIATARRLGAVVMAYDVRAAVREQIESLGARFLEIKIEGSGEGEGGYARQLTEEQILSQREQLAAACKEQDVILTTAAVPGRRAPILLTAGMVKAMNPGSVIVDVAAAFGGNCELTRPGETVEVDGVQILGPTNLPASVPYDASVMYSRNLATFFRNMIKDRQIVIDTKDDIVRETLVCRDGKVVHPKVQTLLGIEVSA